MPHADRRVTPPVHIADLNTTLPRETQLLIIMRTMDASKTGLAEQEGIKRTVDHAIGIWTARNKAKEAAKTENGALACQHGILAR